MGIIQDFYGIYTGSIGDLHGFTWDVYGTYGFYMGFIWDVNGSIYEFILDFVNWIYIR